MDFKKTFLKISGPITILYALSGGVSAYQYPGMQNLSDFIADLVLFFPNLIPLVIVSVIIATVYILRGFLSGILGNATKRG